MAETKLKYQALGAGTVLQVVNATYGSQTDYTTTGWVDTGLTATITPKYSTSKILVIVNVAGISKNVTAGGGLSLQLLRGASVILAFLFALWYNESGQMWGGVAGGTYLDSPATTSATTYKAQGAVFGASGTTSTGNSATSTITLMEIAQ
jgi:hypothetical protein